MWGPDTSATLRLSFPSTGWRLTFRPIQFHETTYELFAYAQTAVGGKEKVWRRFFTIHD